MANRELKKDVALLLIGMGAAVGTSLLMQKAYERLTEKLKIEAEKGRWDMLDLRISGRMADYFATHGSEWVPSRDEPKDPIVEIEERLSWLPRVFVQKSLEIPHRRSELPDHNFTEAVTLHRLVGVSKSQTWLRRQYSKISPREI
jgi:hypothetical protein